MLYHIGKGFGEPDTGNQWLLGGLNEAGMLMIFITAQVLVKITGYWLSTRTQIYQVSLNQPVNG